MHAHFTRLVLQNWRNFKSVDVALAQRVFVVGPNASGKSNLLDALRFLHEIAVDGGGLTNALKGANRGGLRTVRSLHAGQDSAVTVGVEVLIEDVTWTYRLTLQATGTSQKPGPAIVEEERVERSDQSEPVLVRPGPADKKDRELLFETALETRAANATFRPLRDLLRAVEYIHVVPQLVRQPGIEDHDRFGKGLGVGLVEAIAQAAPQERGRRLRQMERALKTVLPQLTNLESTKDKAGRPHLRAKYKHWRPAGGWQQESAFSDGTLRLLGLLWYLSMGDAPLLLEEPELSLHPAAVRQIPRILAGVAQTSGRQVLMTTHSPDLLSDTGIEPAEVLLLTPNRNGTGVAAGTALPEIVAAAKAGLSLGDLVEARTRPPKVLQLGLFGGRP